MFESLFSQRGLSLDRLKTLLEVHEAGGIAAAVPGSPSQQSQYSRQLRDLSQFFATEITRRDGKRLVLTSFGVQLALLARTQFTALTDLRAASRASAMQYRIVAGESLLQWLVVPRLRPLLAGGTRASFSTFNVRTSDAVHRIQEAQADFGIVRKDSVPRGVRSFSLGTLRFGAAIPKAMAPRKPTISEMLSLPLAVMSTDGQFTSRLHEVAKGHGTTLSAALACQSFPQLLGAVRSGSYAAIVPLLAFAELLDSQAYKIKFDAFKSLDRELVLIWNPRTIDVRPGAAAVLDFLKESLSIS